MQHAPNPAPVTTLPPTPPNELTCGIDWARDDHAVSVVDSAGREVHRWTVDHTDAGLRALLRRLDRLGVAEVGIERPDGPVVPALLEAALTVVVISPNQLKNLRGRYGSAGNKDDRFDAFVLADTLRTDRARLRPFTPDSAATVTLRAACRARKDLVNHRVALANQLRAHLQLVFPGGVGLFAELDSPISLRFLARFDKTLAEQLAEQLDAHADVHIFTSLPRSGTVHAARLLAEIGDCRARFPTPESLACLAGVAPSTRQSGKTRSVGFRWAADKQPRDAACDFAGDSRRANPWAADLYQRALARGHDHPHAVRILARAWLYVIWHCWQDGVAYDPARHKALQRILIQQRDSPLAA